MQLSNSCCCPYLVVVLTLLLSILQHHCHLRFVFPFKYGLQYLIVDLCMVKLYSFLVSPVLVYFFVIFPFRTLYSCCLINTSAIVISSTNISGCKNNSYREILSHFFTGAPIIKLMALGFFETVHVLSLTLHEVLSQILVLSIQHLVPYPFFVFFFNVILNTL